MSTDRRPTMGVHHLTVVPENFDPAADRDSDSDGASAGDDHRDSGSPEVETRNGKSLEGSHPDGESLESSHSNGPSNTARVPEADAEDDPIA